MPFLDSTAANTIGGLARKAAKRGVSLVLTGTSHDMRRELFVHGIKPPLVAYERTIEDAVSRIHGPGSDGAPASEAACG